MGSKLSHYGQKLGKHNFSTLKNEMKMKCHESLLAGPFLCGEWIFFIHFFFFFSHNPLQDP